MSRFKPSKYRNAFSHAYKKEFWVNDLKVGSNLGSRSHNIKASCQFLAFHHDATSLGTLAVLPIETCGRFKSFPQIAGHAGTVTDFDFSPFHDCILATGSEDCHVKLWRVPEGGVEGVLSTPTATLGPFQSGVELVHFHPAADNVLAVGAGSAVKIWDVEAQQEMFALGGHEETVEGVAWQGGAGALLATVCKDNREKRVRVFDPRTGSCSAEVKVHAGMKDSQVLWLGDSNYLLTAGFSLSREAELMLWDVANLATPLSRQSLGSTGSPMLLFDEDSKLVFSATKGESTVKFFEFKDTQSHLTQGPHVYHGSAAQKGIAAVPKRAVDVVSCQVVRLLQLTQSAIIPVGFHVQRKSRDFQEDLFPDTAGPSPATDARQWCEGANKKVAKVSLDPAKRRRAEVEVRRGPARVEPSGKTSPPGHTPSGKTSPPSLTPSSQSGTAPSEEPPAAARSPPPVFVRSSKFRHVEGHSCHRSTHIAHLPKLSSTVPGDSNAFQANRERVAAVLSSAGGQVGVFELGQPGRLDKDNVPTLQNTADVMDFTFDPFDNSRLVVACDDARIRVWDIPKGGLTKTLTEPTFCLVGHQEKPNLLSFHPQARSILASAGYDGKLLLWNMESRQLQLSLDPLTEPLFAMAWSPCGRYLATYGKDYMLRLYEPRKSPRAVRAAERIMGSRGARLAWLSNDHFVLVGFNKSSLRSVLLFNSQDLADCMGSVGTDVSPATLIPHYDPDTMLLYLTGKGDSKVVVMEYVPDKEPFLFEVNPFMCGSLHQGVAFLPKVECDVKKVEVTKGIRLLSSSVEPMVFTVPRAKPEFFQDDIFCDTRVTWEAALSASDWLSGADAVQRTIGLCPEGMQPLSAAPKAGPAHKKYQSYDPSIKTGEEKKEELMAAMITKMGDKDEEPLPQVKMDGVDSDEWSD